MTVSGKSQRRDRGGSSSKTRVGLSEQSESMQGRSAQYLRLSRAYNSSRDAHLPQARVRGRGIRS